MLYQTMTIDLRLNDEAATKKNNEAVLRDLLRKLTISLKLFYNVWLNVGQMISFGERETLFSANWRYLYHITL